jgi:hypothetical protein
MPNQPILFSLKECRTLTPETWQRFTTAVRANSHQLASVFRAFVLRYLEKGLGPAEKVHQTGRHPAAIPEGGRRGQNPPDFRDWLSPRLHA